MIPAFAMERTQDLLYHLNDLIEHGRVPKIPIYIDSPLAIKLTVIYKKYEMYFDEATRAMIGRGVFAGASRPYQLVTAYPFTPASAIVGNSGEDFDRFGPVTAMPRSRPARTCGWPDTMLASAIWMLPAIRSG